MSIESDRQNEINRAAERFSVQFYVIHDSYQGPDYPYTAPACLIDSGPPPNYPLSIQSGSFQVEKCIDISDRIKSCRMKKRN